MSSVAEIEKLEEELRAAMITGDIALLDEMLSDTLIFTNQDGVRLSKADDLSEHRSGLLTIEAIEVLGEPLVRMLEDTAVVCLTAELAGQYGGQAFKGRFAYSRVWHRTGVRWRIEAAHCSAVTSVD